MPGNPQKMEASASPSSTTNSPICKKRLLADPRPKSLSPTGSRDSSLSSDLSSDRFCKKTRELPNLSDCHGCGFRVNHTNPKDRLQTIDSVWRIVLLCKKCIKSVESGQACSYCFSKTSENECFCCRDCKRLIHKDCIVRYRNVAPWSYCDLGSLSSICVDCWVPKSFLNTVRRRDQKIFPKLCSMNDPRGTIGESRVSVDSNSAKSLEDVVEEAKSAVDRQVDLAVKAKENALRKAMAASRAMNSANNALDFVAKRDEKRAKSESMATSSESSDAITTMAVDDAELAFQLHRAMNSSPRISKNLCLINLSCVTVSKNDSLSFKLANLKRGCSTGDGGGLDVRTTIDQSWKLKTTVSEPFFSSRPLDNGSCVDLDGQKEVKVYSRTRLKGKVCKQNGEIGLPATLVEKCRSADDNRLNVGPQDFLKHNNGSGTQGQLKCDGNDSIHQGKSWSGNPDLCLLKYTRRPKRSKPVAGSETSFLYDSPGVHITCYKESGAFSGSPLQVCAFNVDAFACASGSPQEQP